MKKETYFRLLRYIIAISVGVIIGMYLLYPKPYKELVYSISQKYEIDPLLVYSVMRTESKYNTDAVSRSGAKGLMQIMDQTGEWGALESGILDYTPNRLFDPKVNIEIGTWYLSKLLIQYEGDIDLALAAYNAGSGNVAKWRSNTAYSSDGKTIHTIPFRETKSYINKVNMNYKIYKWLYKN